jgi:hypothetical protein
MMENREPEEREDVNWGRIYLAVIGNTVVVFMALWWFSKAFR